MDPKLLDATEVAAILKCSESTIYKLVESKSLRHIRLIRGIRFDPKDIEAFIEGRKRGGADGR